MAKNKKLSLVKALGVGSERDAKQMLEALKTPPVSVTLCWHPVFGLAISTTGEPPPSFVHAMLLDAASNLMKSLPTSETKESP